MSELSEKDWKTLLNRIAEGKCTAVLGRGVGSPEPPVGVDPAAWTFQYPMNAERCRQWAAEVGYPFSDPDEFDRVAQFVSIQEDRTTPKDFIKRLFEGAPPPDFSCENEPHRILAALPIPVYLTTNFDDYLTQALRKRGDRDAVVRLCPWNKHLPPKDPDLYDAKKPEPSVANPLVYHSLGRWDAPDSLVVAEDDHYEFLMNVARDEQNVLNHWVQRALGDSAILLVGYSLHDRDFLVLLRVLDHFLRDNGRTHVAVQLEPSTAPGCDRAAAAEYLDTYFDKLETRIYRGDCKKFTAELWSRWKARTAAPAGR